MCTVYVDRNTIIACALTNKRFHICVTFHPLQCELIDLHLGHTLTVCCVTHLQCWEPNNYDYRSQFTPKFNVSLDHMNTQRNCRHDDTKTQSNVIFVCFSVSNSPIFPKIFSIFALLYFKRGCLQGIPRVLAH